MRRKSLSTCQATMGPERALLVHVAKAFEREHKRLKDERLEGTYHVTICRAHNIESRKLPKRG